MELLSPVGDFDCLKAAVQNGADSVYLGATSFSARASAKNFDLESLNNAINYAKLRGVKVYLALNTLIKNNEFAEAVKLAEFAYNSGIDAIIVQDIGLACFLLKNLPNLPIHASTQMTIHNLEGALELEKLGFKRVILSRELFVNEIDYISRNCNIELECFIHGALCISYSGQCLFSSIIGGRSGNRGSCAGPCRLPYELLRKEESTYTKIDSGYLLNTKDLCGLEYIPSLIDAGIKCFKIEGRLKNPEYVATVTRIYRKYIDMYYNNDAEYVVSEEDKKELLLSFNRGGFSSGHLDSQPNQDLIYKNKGGHTGIYVGNVSGFNPDKGYVKVQLNEPISIGDTVCLQREETKYTISELLKGNKNVVDAEIDTTVQIGRIKGNIKLGDRIYKLSSKKLLNFAKESFAKENRKQKLDCKIILEEDKPIILECFSKDFSNISAIVKSNVYPTKAINKPIEKQRIIEQIKKTGNTPFEFDNIDISLGNNLYIPNISIINELRRTAIEKIEQKIINSFKRKSKLKYYNYFPKNKNFNKVKISLMLNTLSIDYEYDKLENIDNIYIPLKYFANNKYEHILKLLSNKFDLYIYMPNIVKGNYKNIFKNHIDEALNDYNVKGFIVSNIADIKLLENYKGKYEFIGNHTLNVFNSNSISEFKKLGLKKLTLSLELNKSSLSELCNSINIPKELIVYGRTPLMTTNYCFLGKSNKCFPECSMLCNNGIYYLKDRMGYLFRLGEDIVQTTSTIYNSKITSITYDNFNVDSVRIDIIDKNINQINYIVSTVKLGKRFEGQDYTNGNLNKTI